MGSKVGLITIHDTQNYGSLLQTYATYKALVSLNVDTELINYRCEAIYNREKIVELSDCNSLGSIAKYLLWNKKQKEKYDNIWKFIKENMNVSELYLRDNISDANDKYDSFVVGSDIVWGMQITGRDFTYMLDFADDNKKKVSVASSAGEKWDDKSQVKVKELLSRFEHISVRETDAAEWVEELTGKKADVVCDPTMLWTGDEWSRLLLNREDRGIKEKYILVYLFDPQKKILKDAIEYGKKTGLPVYFINFYTPVRGTKTVRPTKVEEWLTLINNAEIVFSASYHGMLFSMYFGKEFFYYNRGNRSRMISLGKILGIEHREGLDENLSRIKPIDYDYVNKKMDEMRTHSWNTIKRYLEK